MKMPYKSRLILLFALLVLLAGLFSVHLALAKSNGGMVSRGNIASSATPATARLDSMHVVDASKVPVVTSKSVKSSSRNLQVGGDHLADSAKLKASAAHNPDAPVAPYVYPDTNLAKPNTIGTIHKFQGMTDSFSICPPFGCSTPDLALAASPSWVLEGVNTSFAVYSTSGALQAGWPKNAQNFFGVPNLPHNCDTVPYLIDVRAFYDINDGRFWAAIYQNENVAGHGTNCPFQTLFWVAVSQTNNPNGLWNAYSFDMSLGTTNAFDFSQFGFDSQAVYFSGDMYNQAGTAYRYAEIFAANKSLMESGASVTPHGFSNLMANGVVVDTVQPVETQAPTNSGLTAGLFISAFNLNSGSCVPNCSGVAVWAMANPTTATPSLTNVVISTPNYTKPPSADQPGCTACMETADTRITATPVYHNGLITFSLNTGVNNGTQVVPAIFWGQVKPTLNSSGVITGGTLFQSGNFDFSGDTAASFGALMPDNRGDLIMLFEKMSHTINPQVDYTSRLVSFTPGRFHDGGIVLKAGAAAAKTFGRWGDYEATSYDGTSSNDIWFAGEYTTSSGDWSTYIGASKFT